MVEAKKREVVNPIGRLVGFACVGSPFQQSLVLCLFLDKKCNVKDMSNRMLEEPLLASLLRVVITHGCLHPLSSSAPHNFLMFEEAYGSS
jgi:hypothetical protein